MTDEQTPVNDGGDNTQQTETQKAIPTVIDQIRNAEAQHREKLVGVPEGDTDPAGQDDVGDVETDTRMFPYQANKEAAEIELEEGLNVEPGSPGEMQLRNILGGYGAFKAAQETGGGNALTEAIEKQTEVLEKSLTPKEEPKEFNAFDYVLPEELPAVESAISAFEEVGLEKEKAEQLVKGIYGSIGRTRAHTTLASEKNDKAQEANAVINQMHKLHTIDPDLPNPLLDVDATATNLMNGFVPWMQKKMGINPDFSNPRIVSQYETYKNSLTTKETLTKNNLGDKTPTEPTKKSRKDVSKLKEIASALAGGTGSPVGNQLSEQEAAEFYNLPQNRKKAIMNTDYRYFNLFSAQNGGPQLKSNEELNLYKAGALR